MPINVQSFHCTYNTDTYTVPLVFTFPLLATLCLPFVSPSTYLAPSSCDRNRPPRSQVACKLTPFTPPFTQLSHPFQIPRTPTAQRLTKTTSGIFRLLLSGTVALCLLPTGKYEFWENCWFLNKIESKKVLWKLWPMECTLQNLKQKVTYEGRRESDWRWWLPTCECTKVQCTIQRVQPDRGHHCGSKHNKRYDSTGLLSEK